MRHSVSGFSILELLFVVAIIGILTAIAVPSHRSYRDKALVRKAIGPDGQTNNSLSHWRSEDGVVRGSDGAFVGLGTNY